MVGVVSNGVTVRPALRNVIHVDYSTRLTLIRDQAGTINDASASFSMCPRIDGKPLPDPRTVEQKIRQPPG